MRESKESGNPDIPMPEDLKQGFSLFGNHVLLTFYIDFYRQLNIFSNTKENYEFKRVFKEKQLCT